DDGPAGPRVAEARDEREIVVDELVGRELERRAGRREPEEERRAAAAKSIDRHRDRRRSARGFDREIEAARRFLRRECRCAERAGTATWSLVAPSRVKPTSS